MGKSIGFSNGRGRKDGRMIFFCKPKINHPGPFDLLIEYQRVRIWCAVDGCAVDFVARMRVAVNDRYRPTDGWPSRKLTFQFINT